MLAVASNLFNRQTSLSAYNLHNTSSSSHPSPSSSSTNLPSTSTSSSSHGPITKPFNVGLWKVVGATHKTTGKDVSVWMFEKRILDSIKGDSGGRSAVQAKEWVLEQLKKEATSLSRLRHPDILHTVEPLEELRAELIFVTEFITSSLSNLLSVAAGNESSSKAKRPPGAEATGEVDLDEVEIQKGTLQIAKGLAFLHGQAKMVHLNLSPDAILINAKGDWKLSGLGLTTPLQQPDGTPTKYVFPEVDSRLPPPVQWRLDYLAPEYALDSTLSPANDLYSLGCVLYAVHMGGRPPFRNRGSMQSLRENCEGSLVRREWARGSKWDRCSSELRDLLPRLLTRHPQQRLSLASLPSHSFFSSLAISTLNFLDSTTFASKPREEKATFLRGLVRVLPSFSDRLRKGKILPSLLEEMKDPYLLPFILPNVFEISKTLTKEEFTTVLPKLQPLFALKDPPQNMLTLLEHLSLFEEKTIPAIFRENVMPLIYNSLECEHLPVQEKVLKTVPHLCEILDYGTVQNILLVKVAILFTRTRILGVKVQTLECFASMVKTLDKATLTTKLVPLLAKIKTKEPAAMMATLAVHEAMGAKVDREAIATLVLPQLWAMSMGPLLNADQFSRFMTVIKSLGQRVEQEHTQHLRDVRRLEAQTSTFDNALSNGSAYTNGANGNGGEVDFESLVKGQSESTGKRSADDMDFWTQEATADDGMVSSFNGLMMQSNTPTPNPTFPTSFPSSPALPSQPRIPSSSPVIRQSAGPNQTSKLGARPVPALTFNSGAFASSSTSMTYPAMTPGSGSFAPMQPTQATSPSTQTSRQGAGGPNYNLDLAQQVPAIQPALSFMSPPLQSSSTSQQSHRVQTIPPPYQPKSPQPSYTYQPQPKPTQPTIPSPAQPMPPLPPLQPQIKPPPGWNSGVMQPTKKTTPALSWGNGNGDGKGMEWGDFDPLK